MIEFDLQRFDDEPTADAEPETSADDAQDESPAEEPQPLPEELNGLPEEYAREVLDEWEKSKPQSETEQQPESQPAPVEEQPITREQYQAAINELNQLKAKYLALNQAVQPQQPPQQQQQVQQPQQPQFKITQEISKQLNDAIEAEAMALSGMSKDDVASLDYADADDPRIAQWNQAKYFAQNRVYGAIQQAQFAQHQQGSTKFHAQ